MRVVLIIINLFFLIIGLTALSVGVLFRNSESFKQVDDVNEELENKLKPVREKIFDTFETLNKTNEGIKKIMSQYNNTQANKGLSQTKNKSTPTLTLPSTIGELVESAGGGSPTIPAWLAKMSPQQFSEINLPSKETVESIRVDVREYLEYFSTPLLVFGIVFTGLAILGCVGVCSKLVLKVYLVILNLTLLVVIIVSVLKGKLLEKIRPKLVERLNTYKGIIDFTPKGATWSGIMIAYECCGVDNYKDFNKDAGWVFFPGQQTPLTCCKDIADASVNIIPCVLNGTATDANNWMSEGCFEKINKQMNDTGGYYILFAVTAACIGVLIGITGCVIKDQHKQSRQTAVNSPQKTPQSEKNTSPNTSPNTSSNKTPNTSSKTSPNTSSTTTPTTAS